MTKQILRFSIPALGGIAAVEHFEMSFTKFSIVWIPRHSFVCHVFFIVLVDFSFGSVEQVVTLLINLGQIFFQTIYGTIVIIGLAYIICFSIGYFMVTWWFFQVCCEIMLQIQDV